MKKLKKIFTYWRDDLFGSKAVPDYRTITDEVEFNKSGVPKDFRDREFKGAFGKEKEYPYNIEFGDGRTKKEMDKMQEELMECGCLSDCGCKE